MGGPDSMEAIRPFLENLFADPEIINFPLMWLVRRPLAATIAKRRALKVAAQYEAMGGKSPLKEITLAQAKALKERLGEDFSVHVAMRYWHPFAVAATLEARLQKPDRIVVLPLYPHYCRATTGSSIGDLEKALNAGGLAHLPKRTITSWQGYGPYIDALAEAVAEKIKVDPSTFLLFSAHGLPVKLIKEGDPYLSHVQETHRLVMERFPGMKSSLAFQSRAGPVKWLEPSTGDALRELAAKEVKSVTVVPVSFVSDHIETLREIDVEYRELAHGLGIDYFARVESMNTRPSFIGALEALVRDEASRF